MEQPVDFFRLVTGEDIVSEYEEADGIYILINPCKVVYLSSQKPGYLSISLMQWVFSKLCSEQVFDIPKNQVLFKSPVSESMVDHYYHSVQYFEKNELKKKIDFDAPIAHDDEAEEEVEFTEETSELLEKIMNTIKKSDKRKLH